MELRAYWLSFTTGSSRVNVGIERSTMGNMAEESNDPSRDFQGDLEVSQKLPSKADLAKVADLSVLDVGGRQHKFKSLYAREDQIKKTAVIFIRHFFCGVRSTGFSLLPKVQD